MKTVTLDKLVEDMQLKNMTPELDTAETKITLTEINRPALQLSGYYDFFVAERVQIIGYVEHSYLVNHLSREEKIRAYEDRKSTRLNSSHMA